MHPFICEFKCILFIQLLCQFHQATPTEVLSPLMLYMYKDAGDGAVFSGGDASKPPPSGRWAGLAYALALDAAIGHSLTHAAAVDHPRAPEYRSFRRRRRRKPPQLLTCHPNSKTHISSYQLIRRLHISTFVKNYEKND